MDNLYRHHLTGQGFSSHGQLNGHSDMMERVTGSGVTESNGFDGTNSAVTSPNAPDHGVNDQDPGSKTGGEQGDSNHHGLPQFTGMMSGNGMNNFQFPPSVGMGHNAQLQTAMFPGGNVNGHQGNAQLNFVPFVGGGTQYGMTFPAMQSFRSSGPTGMQPNVNMATAFIPQNMPMNSEMSDSNISAMMKSGMMPVNFMTQGQMMQPVMMAPIFSNMSNMSGQVQGGVSEPGANDGTSMSDTGQSSPIQEHHNISSSLSSGQMQNQYHSMQSNPQSRPDGLSKSRQNSVSSVGSVSQAQASMQYNQTMSQGNRDSIQNGGNNNASWDKGVQNFSAPSNLKLPQESYNNAYSSTGFDILAVLSRVHSRSNQQINIGAVDLSCAFVVCNAQEHDSPIVYCSENFERLTGYTKHEILGRNCRFLQAPNGKVQAGLKRAYVDDDSVLYLKNMITTRSEAQVSLINYRKGGQPFMNLLSMIPVSYDTDDIKYYVGFQVDLVEQPGSVTNKNSDGSYTVNYQRGLSMPRYVFPGVEKLATIDSGQTIPRDDVSTVLSTIGSGESELSKRIWDKVLLENTDDVVFVLSLKGLFLYLSPACKKVLEYESMELTGTALSSVCHPSDIVPVTRELKDTTSSASVSVVFRIRRKNSGYMWFEGHGALHTEQGKGRKSIVLTGRERPVYALNRADIGAIGGIGENEVWTKLSTSGMFLYVSSSIRALLDKQPTELVGNSIQSLMRPDSRTDFMRILEISRSGRRAQTRHELLNKRGQVLQAFSVVYPGDATKGHKPTFFIAQTKLLKYSRAPSTTPTQRPATLTKLDRDSNSSSSKPGALNSAAGPLNSQGGRAGAAQSLASPTQYMSTFEAATTYSGHDSLPLGHQDLALADELNLFGELKTTRSTSWQFELRQMEKRNRLLAEELQSLLAARKKRKRRKGAGMLEKECANCHSKTTPEWRRGPSGNRDLCNSCGLRWAKQQGRISPRTTGSARSAASGHSDKASGSPLGVHPGQQQESGSAGETRSIDEALTASSANAMSNAQQTSPAILGRTEEGAERFSKVAKMECGATPPMRRGSSSVSISRSSKIEEE